MEKPFQSICLDDFEQYSPEISMLICRHVGAARLDQLWACREYRDDELGLEYVEPRLEIWRSHPDYISIYDRTPYFCEGDICVSGNDQFLTSAGMTDARRWMRVYRPLLRWWIDCELGSYDDLIIVHADTKIDDLRQCVRVYSSTEWERRDGHPVGLIATLKVCVPFVGIESCHSERAETGTWMDLYHPECGTAPLDSGRVRSAPAASEVGE